MELTATEKFWVPFQVALIELVPSQLDVRTSLRLLPESTVKPVRVLVREEALW